MSVKRLAGDAAPAPAPPSGVQVGDIGPDGRLVGVDGIIDQIGEGLRRQVEPMVRDMILPYVSRDTQLQARVGQAAGASIAHELKPWVILAAGSLAWLAYSYSTRRPARRRRTR